MSVIHTVLSLNLFSMASTDLVAKLKFLDTAARIYATSAPAISAHLMLHHNLEAANAKGVIKTATGTSCSGCGTIFLPGWTSRTTIISKAPAPKMNTKRKKRPGRRVPVVLPEKVVRTDCLKCYRFEETAHPTTPHNKLRKDAANIRHLDHNARPISDISAPALPNPVKSGSANASSKQRSRARKQGGLQALLQKSKTSALSSSAFGLDLSDFLKKG